MVNITIRDRRASYQKRLEEYTSESRAFFPTGWKGDFRELAIKFNKLRWQLPRNEYWFTCGWECAEFTKKTRHLN